MSKKKHKKADKARRSEQDAATEATPPHDGGGFPAMLREAGAALLAKADTPAGREAIASGLALAAAAASAAATRARTEARTAMDATPPSGDATGAATADAGKTGQAPPVVEALSAAASVFMSRLMERKS